MFEQISINDVLRFTKEMKGILIDLRSKEEYCQGHIKGAISLPFEQIEQDGLPYGTNQTIVLYCEYGIRSMRMSKKLFEEGYLVVNTIGGLNQYSGQLERGE